MRILPTGRALIDPDKALVEAGIRERMHVADFGVGSVGHFLMPAAKLVGPEGRVYGVDILKSVLQAAQSRARMAGLSNVEYVWGNLEKVGGSRLPNDAMDMVILVNLLHALKNSEVVQEARRVLGSGGLLLVIDWKQAGALMGPRPEQRLTKEEATAIASRAALKLKKEFDPGPRHYGLVFEKA